MFNYVLATLLVKTVLSSRIISSEDDLMTPDLGERQMPQSLLEPDVINIGSPRGSVPETYDLDEEQLEPHHNHKLKKPRRNNLLRVKNHEARHRSQSSQNLSTGSKHKSGKPVEVGTIRWKPESAVLVENCQRGIDRPSWNETDCISCKCRSNQVRCQKQKCPKLKCLDQIIVEGECCPKCPEKLCETPDGRRFKHGDQWHMDDCTFCKCSKGKVECSVEDCQVPNCKNPTKVPGRCCPVCLDSTCDAANGTKISAEEVWREGPCTHCYCAGGERKCDQERCPYINCTARHRPEGRCCEKCNEGAVDCIESEWGSWSECAVQECGGGMSKRLRTVVTPHKNGGNFCPHMSEARMCPRLDCDVLPVCPVTEWTSWGPCTATCGSGRRRRERQPAKTTGAPMTSLIDCSTTHFEETKQCEFGSCSLNPIIDRREEPVHDDICFQVTWSEWSSCSPISCMESRIQVLINQSHPRGHLCHLLKQIRRCDCNANQMRNQVVKCQVSAWSAWTTCSKTCGPGSTRTKRRRVIQEPSGGAQCPRLSQSKKCKNKPCSLRSEAYSHGELCVTDDGTWKADGDEWLEGSCALCTCVRAQIRCRNTGCED